VSKGKLLAISILWLCIAGAVAVSYRFVVRPTLSQRKIQQTSSSSNYRHQARIAIGSDPAEAILRSSRFREFLTEKRIQVSLSAEVTSDEERLNQLARGDIYMASFGLVGFLRANANVPDAPATIVAILSESRGADGIVGYRAIFPDAKGLNRPDIRFVATSGKSGEALVRLTMQQFHLDQIPANSLEFLPTEGAVFDRYRQGMPEQPVAFVLREPHLGRALENPAIHRLAGSNAFRGPLIEVLVASRDYLVKNSDVVREVVACYFSAAYQYRSEMARLLQEDFQRRGEACSTAEIDRIIGTVRWKNTLENYAQFGIDFGSGLPLLEDAIRDMATLLRETRGIADGSDFGSATDLYYAKILEELKQTGFHPGGTADGIPAENIDSPPISGSQWDELIRVSSPIASDFVFARGSNRLLESSQVQLKELAAALATMPRTYVTIISNADPRGNLEANLALANARGKEVQAYLHELGVDSKRIRVLEAKASGKVGVTLELGQLPY
jgi:flagellar motor protein MotB